MYLLRGTLNQYSGRILFLPYDIICVDLGISRLIGLPILSLRYNGGSSQGLAGLGINSANRKKSFVEAKTLRTRYTAHKFRCWSVANSFRLLLTHQRPWDGWLCQSENTFNYDAKKKKYCVCQHIREMLASNWAYWALGWISK